MKEKGKGEREGVTEGARKRGINVMRNFLRIMPTENKLLIVGSWFVH